MEIVRVVCPKCQVQLDVKNKLNVEQKVIKCPNCGCQLMVRFHQQPMQAAPAQPVQGVQGAVPMQPQYQQPQFQQPQYQQPQYQQPQYQQPQFQQPQFQQPQYQPQPYRRPVMDEGSTIPAGHISKPVANTAGFLIYNNVRYPLAIGRNTIGRRSSTPQATVQIETNGNNTMSRFHAVIETVRMADMSIRAIISNGSNKNPTFVSGVLLNGSDKLILKNGAEIKMGNIILRYELPV